eukprot:7212523-Pyramimonas_sp.AAC.1
MCEGFRGALGRLARNKPGQHLSSKSLHSSPRWGLPRRADGANRGGGIGLVEHWGLQGSSALAENKPHWQVRDDA